MRASIFGELRFESADGEVISLNNRRANLLLAILCIEPGHAMDRDALARLLWANRFAPQAKASLRQCLLELKRKLDDYGLDGLVVSRARIAIDPAVLSCDLDDLEAAFSAGDNEAAIAHLLAIGNRPLIQGATLNPRFDKWLGERREHIDARLRSAIAEAIRTSPKPIGDRLLEAARTRFPTYRTFNGVDHQVSLAVLPFPQLDTVGGDFFLAEGIVDELSTRLAGIEGITLAGRTSIAVVSEKGRTLTEIASELNVSHLIEGEVRRGPKGIQVRLALISGQSGNEVWSDQLYGSIEDFFESRKVIGANVIAAICRALGLPTSPAPSRKMTHDREAYALFLQGRSMVQRISGEEAFDKAIEFFERALAIDPEFAECWTALANAHIMKAALTPSLTRLEQSAKGADCAKRALELDPGQGHALSILGIHDWALFNPARSLERAFEAYARDPNDADVSSRLGSCLLYLGKARDALPYVEASVERDPVYARNYAMLASAYLSLGEFEKARVAGKRMTDLGFPGMWLALAQFALGDCDAAVQTHYETRFLLGTVIMRPPGMPPMDDAARDAYFDIAARGIFSGRQADRSAYCQLIDALHATMPDPYDSSISFPAIWMGHSELVMKIYSKRIHPANIFGLMSLWIDIEPINHTIRHPGFIDFAEGIGMVEAWERFGWPDLMPADPRKA
ncbi:hypothetical protein [Tsuneonella dongtanensis]|uniref:hypothetical protein n=1 Tax=Tsuneonella dongtanensis TaxID=692370 RepID=UPI0012EDFCB3|nr:hypothetical protein [Tsuneonella dongtanensis]